MAQTTSTPSTTSLDKFYSRPETATACQALLAARLPGFSADLFIVRAAGDGVFLDRLPAKPGRCFDASCVCSLSRNL